MWTLKDLLHGTEPGNIQSVGVMQVIPLILTDPDIESENFVSPMENADVQFGSDNYGVMSFYNNSDKFCIVPMHTYMANKKLMAQDHTMCTAGLAPKDKATHFRNAACIQASQGGHIQPSNNFNFSILPYNLKEDALKTKAQTNFQKLWSSIQRFNQEYGLRDRGGHLEIFLNSYQKELDEFIAEFELVDNQIGAIILMNGQVVGVEVAPNRRFWRSLWEPLIRDSYGSLAIKVAKEEKEKPTTREPLDVDNVNDIQDLKNKLEDVESKEVENTKEVVRNLLDESLSIQVDQQVNDIDLTTVTGNMLTGQVVNEFNRIYYVSLFTSKSWYKHRHYHKAKSFDI